jgi:hypothetical protein
MCRPIMRKTHYFDSSMFALQPNMWTQKGTRVGNRKFLIRVPEPSRPEVLSSFPKLGERLYLQTIPIFH